MILWFLTAVTALGHCDPTLAELVDDGVAAAQRHEFRRAIDAFDLALNKPNLPPREQAIILNNRGNAFKKIGHLHDADSDYTRALQLTPELPKPLYDRGIVHFLRGQFETAAADLKIFLQKSPDMPSPYPYLWLYLAQARAHNDKLGDNLLEHAPFQEQITWPGPLIRLHRDFMDTSTLLSYTGDRVARKHLENQCDAYFHIGEYHLLRGDRLTAKRWFRQAMDTGMTHLDEYAAARAEWQALDQKSHPSLPSLLELDPEAILPVKPSQMP
ncbi:MAG: hypothetical protein HQL64_06005 [Magnetococcales bacterium]|nr:hypothetical protein [Magnetococcales bacterium]